MRPDSLVGLVPRQTMRFTSLRRLRALAGASAILLLAATASAAQLTREPSAGLSDAEFWRIFSTMSEPGGSFASENFVSNEMTFQYVIPSLQKTTRPGGVYLGVGPEQNFTYIANLSPRLAIIFDIRRQNAMAHLMYKAMFELSPTRGDFVSRLFSRPLTGRVASTARVDDLFAVATAAARSDSAYAVNRAAVFAQLVDKHRFALTPGDSAAIEHLLEVFYEAGPDINYGYRLNNRGTSFSSYPSYGMLQTRRNADSVQMAFLANEENYRAVRDMQMRNLIVPVVGDFAGPKAIRAVGEYLKGRNLTVAAYYLSNVEQYLYQNNVADRFYANVATLPIDSSSMFIRSVPPGGGGGYTVTRALSGASGTIIYSTPSGGNTVVFGPGTGMSMSVFDTLGYRALRMSQDSAGLTITRTYRDSAGKLILLQADTSRTQARIIATPNFQRQPFSIGPQAIAVGGASLVSGLASIKRTIEEHAAGRLLTYRDVINMTRLEGWR